MAQIAEAIRDFWFLFQRRAADLALARSANDSVYEVLLAQLQVIDRGLFLEFSANRGACELIVTAYQTEAWSQANPN